MGKNILGEQSPRQLAIACSRSGTEVLQVGLSGSSRIWDGLPSTKQLRTELETDPRVKRVVFDTQGLSDWDSSLLAFVKEMFEYGLQHGIEMDPEGLPPGLRRLLALASAVPEKKDARRESKPSSLLSRVGTGVLDLKSSSAEMVAFIGETFLAFINLARGRARFRLSDLALFIQECGAQALPIVSLISVLVGLILAFVGSIQLRLFGAQIYVADLVGLGMAREMGAMMTAIIMAGRTGSAFAAQLGSMQVNEEIDAFKTMGISPVEFLVLPRVLALVLMLPPLCLYADFMGIVGGGLVGIGMLDLSVSEYFNETKQALHLVDFVAGLIKSGVFGVLVALSGCLRGMQCGRSSSAVGDATTSAVVTSIVFIIVSDSILTVIYDVIGF